MKRSNQYPAVPNAATSKSICLGSIVRADDIRPWIRPAGFTLVELLVVIAIIGIMVGMMLPALNSSRDWARRATCSQQLGCLIQAVHNYELANEVFPSGVTDPQGPIRQEAVGQHIGWIAHLLPYLDEQNAYDHLALSAGAYAPANADVRRLTLQGLTCPASPLDVAAESNYAGCHHDVEAPIDADNHGVFFRNSRLTWEDLRDGAAHTIFVGEKLSDEASLGWLSGTRATLRNTGTPPSHVALPGSAPDEADPLLRVGGFGSHHVGRVVQFAFGDGSVRALPPDIDEKLYRQLGHRADGQLIDSTDW